MTEPTPAITQSSEFTLTATGDAIITRRVSPYEGNSPRFDDMLSICRTADAAVTNLEVLVHDYQHPAGAHSGGTYMRAPPTVLDELKEMGFSLFAAATNHSFDYGHGGIEETIAALHSRDLTYAGLGSTLFEARSPGYYETSAGRVGLVSVCTSFPPGSKAGEQSRMMQGRPGLNSLEVDRVYRLTASNIEKLQAISDASGFEEVKQSWLDRGIYYNHDWNNSEYYHLEDTKFELVETEAEQGVGHVVSDSDREALCGWVEEADRQADWVIASIHSHQGAGGRQTTEETPEFLVDVAHDCVDAGADAVIGHGPHVLRGIELYSGVPIFYSLGNFIVQNETVSRLPPESFGRYDLGPDKMVSDVFSARLFDDDQNPKGDLANDAFWETFIPVCTYEQGNGELERIELHPVTLQATCNRPQRGIPILARGSQGRAILERIKGLSTPFDTSITIEETVGIIDG